MYMNKLSNEKRSQIIRGLVEGNSISSLVRMTGIAKSTILRLILGFGAVCEAMHDERVKDLSTVRVQMDEVWAFVGAKDKNASDEKKVREGDPDPKHISTSFVERHNLTLRMGMRRYTRLTNGHSKKFENHLAMTSIFMTCYNFCRVHQTLRVTPAMEAGLTDHVWEVEEILCLMD
jgi:hypothetical protein